MAFMRSKILRSSESTDNGYLSQLGLTDSGHLYPTAWITDAIRSVSSLWSMLVLFKLCLIAVMVNLIHAAHDPLALNLPLLAAMVATDLLLCLLRRISVVQRWLPHDQMRLLTTAVGINGFVTTLWFAILPDILAGQMISPLLGQTSLVILAIAIFGGRQALSLSYCLGAGAAVLFTYGWHTSMALAVFLVAMAIVTLVQARGAEIRRALEHKEHIRGRRSLQLLGEYEQSGRGWFWETDRTGCITYISETLAKSLDINQSQLVGRALTDLIAAGDRMATDGDRTLGFHLSARTSFSVLAGRVAMSKEERWWAISGRPIVNEYGQFHGFRGSGSDLTEMRRSQAEVNRLAQYDSLTGLANRVQMQRTLEQAVIENMGKTGECALFLLDLDRFKSVNDTMGHPAGDALLRLVSHRLQQVVGDRGRVGRLGGDEFKVVLPGLIDRVKLATLADAIIATLSQPYDIEGAKVVIGASVGIALCPQDGVTTDALIRNADLALYAAKGEGRGVHRFYSPEMHADAEDRRQLEEDLRHALASDGLTIVYQPVISAATERVAGFEALLRWQHPTRGAISPTHFIPIAEDAGLITQIGEWVLRSACMDAAQWPASVRVAVNVSPIQFANPNFPTVVMNALASANLPPARLELEITESVFLNDDDSTEAMFAQLKGIGVRLALDDFGTGYSSLGYLKKAPFDKIKIDQSFVRGAAESRSRNSAIIKSIISLAEALDMDTTAEGVETHDELELVRMLGCSHIQGFIYGHGMAAEDVLARFADEGLSAQASGFKSSRPLRKTMLRSVVITHGGQRYPARIRNASSQGAMIEGLWNVPKDTIFTIEFGDDLSVDAIARWSTQDRTGVQFAEEVDMRLLNQAVAPQRMAS